MGENMGNTCLNKWTVNYVVVFEQHAFRLVLQRDGSGKRQTWVRILLFPPNFYGTNDLISLSLRGLLYEITS